MATANSFWKVARNPLTISGVFVAQMLHAIYRTDLPSFEDQDPSGIFGDPAAPRLRIVFLGDSTVTAPGVDPLDQSWARRTAHHFAGRFHVEAISVAAGGAKAEDVRADQVDAAIAAAPDLALLVVGGNDALRMTPISRFEAAYVEIVDRLDRAVPAVGVLGIGDLGTIPRLPAFAGGIARIRSRAIDRAIRRVVARHPTVPVTDAWHPKWRVFGEDPALWTPDQFHGSGAGHGLYADATIPLAEKALELSSWVPAPTGSDGSST